MSFRTGLGYDVHKLAQNRKLILGGVEIPFEKGLLGHSDADVLTHAVIDALAGAAGLGDIGQLFPDTSAMYKNISSLRMLAEVKLLLQKHHWQIENIDATVVAQLPRLTPYKNEMQKNIAATLEIPKTNVNIKATTEEGLGFTGVGQGIAAYAVCLIYTPKGLPQ
jgi:2-C-methyl-D-erythritol 2,4-cyclodiphosphate synthase